MLSKFEDWYKVLRLKALEDEIVRLRKKSIAKVITYLKQPKNKKLIFEAVTFITHKGDPESNFVKFLISKLKEDDPDFVDDFSKRRKELQVLSAIILGELIQSSTNNNKARQLGSISLLAGMIIPISKNLLAKNFSNIFSNIRALVENALYEDGEKLRTQNARILKIGHEKFIDNPNDIITNPVNILDIFTNIEKEIQRINSNAPIEKEPREIYWWVLGKRSLYSEVLFAEMTMGSAVISAGWELADITLFPPQANFNEILNDVLFFEAGYNELEIDLAALVKDWDEDILQKIQSNTKGSAALVYEFPKLFPLSWILLNKLDNNMSDEWTSLFYNKTGFAKSTTLQGSQWAYQAMVERYCMRAYLS
jgi:hypothetical protein